MPAQVALLKEAFDRHATEGNPSDHFGQNPLKN
jgi:hypothetical protein